MKVLSVLLLTALILVGTSNCFDSKEIQHSIPSMILSNWESYFVSFAQNRDYFLQNRIRPVGLNSIRIAPDMSKNNIDFESFIVITDDFNYVDPSLWEMTTRIGYDEDKQQLIGSFITKAIGYNNKDIPFELTKSYMNIPHKSYTVIEYCIKNLKNSDLHLSIADITKTKGDYNDQYFWSQDYQGNRIEFVDFRKQGGYYYGTYGGADTDYGFYESMDSLVSDLKARKMNHPKGMGIHIGILAEMKDLTIKPGQSVKWVIMKTVQTDYQPIVNILDDALNVIKKDQQTALLQDNYWKLIQRTVAKNSNLQSKKDHWKTYQNSIFLLYNAYNPTKGTLTASMAPNYGYKMWTRDALFAAVFMAELGIPEIENKMIKFLSTSANRDDGSYHTTYDFWTGDAVSFVEPQHDPMGLYLLTVHHHFKYSPSIVKDNDVINRVNFINKWILDGIQNNGGFIKPDYSIWEESSDPMSGTPLQPSYYTFSNTLAFGGLQSSIWIANYLNQPNNDLKTAASKLQNTLQTKSWCGNYFCRFVGQDGKKDTRADAASMATVWFNVFDPKSSNVKSHINWVVTQLTRNNYGIARYENDHYFFDGIYSPGHKEVSSVSPPWGVTTMFTAWAEWKLGDRKETIMNRLDWMVQRCADGQIPVGEAVDGDTDNFVWSSAPDVYEHAGVYAYTAMLVEGKVREMDPTKW
eukprot:TRINITY_DN1604_c0_g1_i1.p1 TRINITY_DN1604_c0_g1~~TRINITY_DN1604_c0_g1_i1.p1  ORF type:complete len:701 (+),score=184.71 TRINITY_DN1604_c0_g1_i1:30-2105(+)